MEEWDDLPAFSTTDAQFGHSIGLWENNLFPQESSYPSQALLVCSSCLSHYGLKESRGFASYNEQRIQQLFPLFAFGRSLPMLKNE
jgi:hypothetical protein